MSYDFGAANRRISGTFSSPIDSVNLSIVAWIKLTAAQWDGGNKDWVIHFGEDFDDNDNSVSISVRAGSTADRVSVTSRSTADANANNTLQVTHDDIWLPVIGVWASTASRKLYAQDTTDVVENTTTRDVGAVLDSLRLGAAGAGSNTMDGLLAEVAIFDKVLSDDEINAIWDSAETGPNPNSIAPNDCIGYWSLDTDQSTHADESGNGGPTLTVNLAVFSSDHPTIIHTNASVLSDSLALTDTDEAFALRPRSFADDFVIVDSVEMLRARPRSLFDGLAFDESKEMLRIAQHALADNFDVTEETFAGYTSGEAPVVVDTVLRKTEGITDAVPETPWG